jgi:hypothetical protein
MGQRFRNAALAAASVALAASFVIGGASQSLGQTNEPPPSGAFLDLAGGAVPHGAAVTYTGSFVAGLASTDFTMAFREDPAFVSVYNVSLVDAANPGVNLLTNGDFSGGVHTSGGNPDAPVGWTYDNVFGAFAGGVVSTVGEVCGGAPGGATNCWYDGAVQAYDAIDQFVTTIPGHTYNLSFQVSDNGPLTIWQPLSTNGIVTGTGGNGIDILAYAGAGLPPPGSVPEPSTWAMLLLGFAGLGFVGYRRAARGHAALAA